LETAADVRRREEEEKRRTAAVSDGANVSTHSYRER
jgi:hypothetical protein